MKKKAIEFIDDNPAYKVGFEEGKAEGRKEAFAEALDNYILFGDKKKMFEKWLEEKAKVKDEKTRR